MIENYISELISLSINPIILILYLNIRIVPSTVGLDWHVPRYPTSHVRYHYLLSFAKCREPLALTIVSNATIILSNHIHTTYCHFVEDCKVFTFTNLVGMCPQHIMDLYLMPFVEDCMCHIYFTCGDTMHGIDMILSSVPWPSTYFW
jgi:hypothetical protein